MTKYAQPNFSSIYIENFSDLRQFDKSLISTLSLWEQLLHVMLDRGISFDDNLDIDRVSVTSHVTPGTEFSVAHGLGKVPIGYIVYGKDQAGDIFDGTTTNTKTTVYFKSDASSVTFRIILF